MARGRLAAWTAIAALSLGLAGAAPAIAALSLGLAWAAPAIAAPTQEGGAAPDPATSGTPGAAAKTRDQALLAEARKHFDEGKKRFSLRQFHSALQSFSRAYELMPLPGFLFNIGQCHRFLGDCEKANFFYSGFVRENPDTPDAAVVQKLISRCQKDLSQNEARRARAKGLFEEGRKAQVLQHWPQALRLFTEAYQAFPLPGYLFHLGEVHRAQERYGQAIHFFEAYLKENPGGPEAGQVAGLIDTCRKLREEKRRRDIAAGRIKENLDLDRAGKDGGEKPRPVHKTWWLWTSIAVGVAAAVGLGVGLGTRDNDRSGGTLGNWDPVP